MFLNSEHLVLDTITTSKGFVHLDIFPSSFLLSIIAFFTHIQKHIYTMMRITRCRLATSISRSLISRQCLSHITKRTFTAATRVLKDDGGLHPVTNMAL